MQKNFEAAGSKGIKKLISDELGSLGKSRVLYNEIITSGEGGGALFSKKLEGDDATPFGSWEGMINARIREKQVNLSARGRTF